MKKYQFEPQKYKAKLLGILKEIDQLQNPDNNTINKVVKRHCSGMKQIFNRAQLIQGYEYLTKNNFHEFKTDLIKKLKRKPIRTLSGVAVVALMTKPFPCPGECIFCPKDENMPKSYLSEEPGAQRAEINKFDPYLQTYNRLKALHYTGHTLDKIEIIILGGSWSVYPEDYKKWFVFNIFKALNEFNENIVKKKLDKSKQEKVTWADIKKIHKINEAASCRCVGLSVETRPDLINRAEIINMRKLGATKVQLGIQSTDDEILKLNCRGHTTQDSHKAIKLLRTAGFKIQLHWMPNLYGSTPNKDIEAYKNLWEPEYQPDELKIYPTSIIEGTGLYKLYQKGKYTAYSETQLKRVLKECLKNTPVYCRLSRVVRDIPSQEIVAGNKSTNLREIVEKELKKENNPCKCIRCREIRDKKIKSVKYNITQYNTTSGDEFFISADTYNNNLAGFLRLTIPQKPFIDDLKESSIIREIHVYGKVSEINNSSEEKTQHQGIGKKLINTAENITKKSNKRKISVISAVGTRIYYQKQGFLQGDLYQYKILT